METIDRLQEVIDAKGTTIIIYHGGSAPGTARAIQPIAIESGKLTARCLETDTRKTFMLDKVELASAAPIIPRPKRIAEDVKALKTLRAKTFNEFAQEIAALALRENWLLEFTGDKLLAKNANCQHELCYRPTMAGWNTETQKFGVVESERPWHLDKKLFTHKETAFAAFMDVLLAPH
ncbi:hypothetical protein [Rhodanobacter sp. BL-MT-08]